MPGGTNGYASGGTSMFDAAGGGYGVPGYLGLSTLYDPRDYSFTGNFDPSGFVTGAFTTQLIIPVGVSQLGFALVLALDCRNHLATCNFGNTSALTFDPLPDGLSFTSESGQLFTAKAPAPGVPEPASWALMIVGLGVVGGTMRRRRMAVSFA
ncbi:PEPxxWA-CTERM sorting domain-containing protein [Sphingobium sp. H33]|uniref:PEPxxWA-CTERM sorting domain-containing protein n=2 Tax=Sphingobium nicotianae TaxID=2782607 RepID=A0A9X1AIU9_9SPHN|nr:PEPxxWA-CTERM sorting domain-containing protein [Sphingobium nicotianae]